MGLPIGEYKIVGFAYLSPFNPDLLLNQSIYSLSFYQNCALISENVKKLKVVPKCTNNSSLIGEFNGTFVDKVTGYISSTQKFNKGSTIHYQAGKSIILNAGFFVNKTTVFKAEIDTCN